MLGGSRIDKINELLKEQLSQAILKEVDLPPGVLATITRVETTKDLHYAKVFVSAFPEQQIRKVLSILNKFSHILHQVLNKKLRLRRVPKLRFLQDNETDQELHMEEIFDKINQENQS